jgi:ABC-type Fe3+-siderophore transport system permease subunit
MAVMSEPEDTGVPLERIAWMVTVVVCLVTALVTLLSGYVGYAAVVFAIACSAAINLR